jgi:hypothetical protein
MEKLDITLTKIYWLLGHKSRPHHWQNPQRSLYPLLEYSILHSCSMQSCSKGASWHNGKLLRLSSYQSLGTPHPHPYELTSYHPIILLPITSKVLEKLLLRRLLSMTEKSINTKPSIWLQTKGLHDRTDTELYNG